MPAIEPVTTKPNWRSWISKALLFPISLVVCMAGGAEFVLSVNLLRRGVTGFDHSCYFPVPTPDRLLAEQAYRLKAQF